MSDILSWLPPNLQPPKTKQQIPMLVIKITQIAYLQVFFHKPSLIKYKWWGLKAKKSQQALLPNAESVHKFYIGVSLPMFMRYCADMKILQFQLCDSSQMCLARGHINFLLLKGWGGQQYGLTVDMKHVKNNSKIGEMQIKIQIISTQNPLNQLNTSKQIQRSTIVINNVNQVNSRKKQKQNTQKYERKIKKYDLQQSEKSMSDEFNTKNNFINYRIDEEQNYNINGYHIERRENRYIGQKAQGQRVIDDTKTRWYKKFNLPLPDQCICQGIRPNRYEHEKIKLKQQIQMLFKPNNSEFITNQQVHVQFMGWQPSNKNDAKLGCKVSVPILDTEGKIYRNEHYFGLGKGNIKIGIGTKSNKQNYENIIQQYLKNNNIEIVVGDSYVGSLPLYKILGSKGDIMSVGIYETKSKREVLKGHYLLKLVPQNIPKQNPEKRGQQSANTNKIELAQKNIQNEYIWLYLRQMHFVQPQFWQNSNIYVNIKTPSHEQKTKTIWKSDCPTFNEIITVLLNRKQIVLQFWNRQATQRLIGKAFLNINPEMQFEVQIPIMDNYNRIVAYINLCIGKGDIRAATQFLNTHSRAFHQQKPSGSNDIPYSPRTRTQPEPSQQPEPELQQQNEEQIQSSQNEKSPQNSSEETPPIIIPKIPHREQEIELNIIEIHNKIFTQYIAKQYDWLTTYQNQTLSMAQFSHLLKPILSSNINVAKLAALYLNAETNSISLKQIRQSFQAFEVYYNILIDERDMAISNMLQALNEQGLTINDLEYKLSDKIKSNKGNKLDLTWRSLKQYLQPNIIEKIRYFYQNSSINQLFDCLRRFEVYETTKGQQINSQSIQYQISKQLSDLLEIDNHTSTLKQAIKQSGLELSKYELLSLFGEVGMRKQQKKLKQIEIGTKMIKSPTFGLLATDRINNIPPTKQAIQDNQSIDMRIEVPSNKSDMSGGLSQKFGNPNISPINQRDKNKKPILVVKLMDLDSQIQYISINGQQFDLSRLQITQNGSILIQMGKKFNYQGYILVEGDIKLEFDGPAGQWISLTDQMGQYCGSIIFQ